MDGDGLKVSVSINSVSQFVPVRIRRRVREKLCMWPWLRLVQG